MVPARFLNNSTYCPGASRWQEGHLGCGLNPNRTTHYENVLLHGFGNARVVRRDVFNGP